jgi:hypothetical protein
MASWWLMAITLFMDGHADQLGEQGFGETTDLRVVGYHAGKWTAIATDHDDAMLFVEFGQPAQAIEHIDSRCESGMQVAARYITTGRYMVTDGAQERFEFCWGDPLSEHIEEVVQQRSIGFREEMVSRRGEVVDIGGFTGPMVAALACITLLYQAVALKCCQVCTDCIVCEAERLRELVNRATGAAE